MTGAKIRIIFKISNYFEEYLFFCSLIRIFAASYCIKSGTSAHQPAYF